MDLFEINAKINKIPRINVTNELQEALAHLDPFKQFILWFNEVLDSGLYDPSAMVLATIDKNNIPDTRVVLLKKLEINQFIFYTNYKSKKAKDVLHNPVVALNFYWPNMVRQVRIRGYIEKFDRHKSEMYFATRPREAQLSSYASLQSSIISSRNELINKIKHYSEKFTDKEIPCPEYWGGYAVNPFEYEFFQGRQWRMHDRLRYTLVDKNWNIERLSP